MRTRLRLLAATLLAFVAMLVVAVPDASADVCPSCNGGWVYNRTDSSHLILIWNGSQTASIYPGQASDRFTYWQDVDAFQLPYCPGQRIINGLYQPYVYQPGVWYYIGDSTEFILRQSWC